MNNVSKPISSDLFSGPFEDSDLTDYLCDISDSLDSIASSFECIQCECESAFDEMALTMRQTEGLLKKILLELKRLSVVQNNMPT